MLKTSMRITGEPENDGELLSRFSSDGDQAAFAEIVKRHGSMVMRLCRQAHGIDLQAADDAAQQVFLTLANRSAVLKSRVSVAGWLYRAAWNVTAHSQRNERTRRRHEHAAAITRSAQLGGSLESGRTVPFAVVTSELHEALGRALGVLPETYRDALVLHYFGGHTVEETAAILCEKVGTVASWLSRGRSTLRTQMENWGMSVGAAAIVAWLADESLAAQVEISLSVTGADWAAKLQAAVPSGKMGGVIAAGGVGATGAAAATSAASIAPQATMFGLSRAAAIAVISTLTLTSAAIAAPTIKELAVVKAVTKKFVETTLAVRNAVLGDGSPPPRLEGVVAINNAAPSRDLAVGIGGAAASTPEPSTGLLLLTAGGISLMRRQRRSSRREG